MSSEPDASEGSYSQSIGMSDIDSLDGRSSSAGSGLSGPGERVYNRRVAFPQASVHTAAALEVVERPRTRLRSAPLVRDVVVDVKEPLIRPATAPAAATALASVVPTGVDRLKHLQLHMEQLQQLYAHEVHKEELAAREAFVQSMCTASITLWRYATARSRFFTAVKALVTQYLPASNAKLFQVEEEKALSLVMADGSAIAVDDEGRADVGIAGNALWAVSRTPASRLKELILASTEPGVDDKMVQSGGSSSAMSQSPDWLESQVDCIIPTTSEHLVLLLPLERANQLRPDIDLHAKKKDVRNGSQLLVVVLRGTQQRPIGIIQALVSAQNPIKVDFLDAFSSLLAAALEARQSICRSVTGDDVKISIVQAGDDANNTLDSAEMRTIEFEIAPSTKVVIAGTDPESPRVENDMPLLNAVRSSMSTLWKEKEKWGQRVEVYERCERASRDFWNMIMALVEINDECYANIGYRAGLHKAVCQLCEGLDVVCTLRLLFEEDALEDFISTYGEVSKTGSTSNADQFGAMKSVFSSGEVFVSTPRGVAFPIYHSGSRSHAAIFLEFRSEIDDATYRFVKDLVLSTVEDAVRLVLGLEARTEQLINSSQRENQLHGDLISEMRRRYEADSVLLFFGHVVQATSLENFVQRTNGFKWTRWLGDIDEEGWEGMRLTLCVSEFGAPNSNACAVEQPDQIWSISECNGERVVVFDRTTSLGRANGEHEVRRGMAAFVLENAIPIAYTHEHAEFEISWRVDMERGSPSSRTSGFYYATPLPPQPATVKSESLGVLEISFGSEAQRSSFLKSPLVDTLVGCIGIFLTHYIWLRKSDLSHKEGIVSMTEHNHLTWTRWMEFAAAWSTTSELSIEDWRALTVERLKQLVPAAEVVNLLVSCANGDDEQATLIARIEKELNDSGGSNSVALNLSNQALLQAIVALPLNSKAIQNAPRGLLVFAKNQTDDSAFSDEDKRLLVAASTLIETQLRYIWENSFSANQLNLLQRQLNDLNTSLNDERMIRFSLLKQIIQHETLLTVHRFDPRTKSSVDNNEIGEELVASISSVMMANIERVRGILDPPSGTTSVMVALLVSSGAEDDEMWSICRQSNTFHNINVSTEEIDWLLHQETQSVCQDTPHFKLVSRIFGLKADDVHGYHQLAASEVRLLSNDGVYTRSPPGLLVLVQCGRERSESTLNVVDNQFVHELGHAVEHVFESYSLHHRSQRFQMSIEWLEKENESIRAEHKRRSDWLNERTSAWWAVLLELIPEKRENFQVRWSDLHEVVQHHTTKQLKTLLGDEIQFTVEINCIPVDEFCFRKWSLTSVGGTAMIEVSTDITTGLFLARSTCGTQDRDVIAVRVTPSSFSLFEEDIKNVACDAVCLLVTIDHTWMLHDRTQDAAALLSSLQIESQRQDKAIEQLQATIHRSRQFSRVIQRLMRTSCDGESTNTLFDALRELPGYRLWIRDTGGGLWTTHQDGSKQIRSDPSLSSFRDIVLGDDWVARLEVLTQVSESDKPEWNGEIKKLITTLEAWFMHQHLKKSIMSMEAESETQKASHAESRLKEETIHAEVLQHWHRISNLVYPGSDADSNSLSEALSRVEGELSKLLEEISGFRVVLMNVDFDTREIVEVEASTTRLHGDCIKHILSSIDVWDTCATPSLRIFNSSLWSAEITRSFSREQDYDGNIVLVSLSTLLPCPSVVVVIGFLSATCSAISPMTKRALEMDTRLIINQFGAWNAHKILLQRAEQSELDLGVKTEELSLAQQWAEFSQNTSQEANILIHNVLEKIVGGSTPDREGSATHLITFMRQATDCNTVELYVPNEAEPTTAHRVRRMPSFYEFSTGKQVDSKIQAQLELAVQATDISVSTRDDGTGVIVPLSDRTTGHLVGIVVLHFSDLTPSNATLEVTKTTVREWACSIFTLLIHYERQHGRIESQRHQLVIQNSEMAAIKAVGAEMKCKLEQVEQKQAKLLSDLDLAVQNTERLVEFVDQIATFEDEAPVLDAVTAELCKHEDVLGVQVYEERDSALILVTSTFSNAEDDELRQDGLKATMNQCMATSVVQRFRIRMSSGLKHGHAARLGDAPRCIFVLFHDNHHQIRTKITENYISHCIVATAVHMKATEKAKLQASTAETLEYATKELSSHLERAEQALKREQQKNATAAVLYFNLSQDLIAHPVWTATEKSATTSIRTPILVAAWIHLEELALHRIQRVLGGSVVTTQLYGCAVEASGGQEIVFSLPSRKSGERKGFYCVPMEQMQRRSELKGLTKCIVKRVHMASAKSSADGRPINRTIFFPMRFNLVLEQDTENDDGNDLLSETDTATVVGALAVKVKLGLGNDVMEQLEALQGFADALACRVRWIGHVVSKKQQREKAAPPQHPKPEGQQGDCDIRVKSMGTYAHGTGNQTVDHLPHQHVSDGVVRPQRTDIANKFTSSVDSHENRSSLMLKRNQVEVGQFPCDDDGDSEDERRAELACQQIRAAISTELLQFSIHIQILPTTSEAADAALASVVSRDLKQIWIRHGDDRKRALVSCDLYFVENGVVSNTLHKGQAQLSTPLWLQQMDTRTEFSLSGDEIRLKKASEIRWIVCAPTGQMRGILLVLEGGNQLVSTIFDRTDETMHLPPIARILALHVSRMYEHRELKEQHEEQLQHVRAADTRRLDEVQAQYQSLLQRVRMEQELQETTAQLRGATEQRLLIRLALNSMKKWLHCDKVSFHVAASDNSQEEGNDAVAMETILRVRIVAPPNTLPSGNMSMLQAHSSELIGTMVARLSDQERMALDNAYKTAEEKAWLLDLLNRLAKAVAADWVRSLEQKRMTQYEEDISTAIGDIQRLKECVDALEEERDNLLARVDDLNCDTGRIHSLEEENHRLVSEVDRLTKELEDRDKERRAVGNEVKIYESQLAEVNCQLEQSVRAESQLLRLEEAFASTQARESRLQRKVMKQKLLLKHLTEELTARRERDERDQAELCELRKQVAVLTEKQQHSGRIDTSSVASAVMQAQLQVQQQQAGRVATQQQRDRRAQERRIMQQLQLQQQLQKRKQLDLAQELRHLTAMEVQEMRRREGSERQVTRPTSSVKVYAFRDESSSKLRAASEPPTSKLRQPSVVVHPQSVRGSENPIVDRHK